MAHQSITGQAADKKLGLEKDVSTQLMSKKTCEWATLLVETSGKIANSEENQSVWCAAKLGLAAGQSAWEIQLNAISISSCQNVMEM